MNPWIYEISTGCFRWPDGELLGVGHSGFGGAMNDPARVREKNVGPLPPGLYYLGPVHTHPTCGPVSMRLLPEPGTEQHGRSGFLVHGPNRTAALEDDSHGCIILAREHRETLAEATNRYVKVIEGTQPISITWVEAEVVPSSLLPTAPEPTL